MNDSRCTAEMDHLIGEMDRMDEDLARHIADEFEAVRRTGSPSGTLEFARLQIQAWCARAARQQLYDSEVLASTMMAIESMDRRELAEMIRVLAYRARSTPRRPAA
jgi:hypothetical protein